MHFAADEAPFVYTIELWRLFRANNVSARGLWSLGLGDIYRRYARGHLSRIKAGLKIFSLWIGINIRLKSNGVI